MKVAANRYEAWRMQTVPDPPYGWVQWKGTDACIDFTCECGASYHMDGDFLYNVRCPRCKRIFMLNGHIELIQVLDPGGSIVQEAYE